MAVSDWVTGANAAVDSYTSGQGAQLGEKLNKDAAKKALARTLLAGMQQGAMTQGGMAGVGPPQAQPMPPGAPSMPSGPPPAPPQGAPGMPPPGLANMGGGGAPPPPQTPSFMPQGALPKSIPGQPTDIGVPPQGGGGGAPPAQPPQPQPNNGLSGTADPSGSVVMDIQKTLSNLAQQISKANPDIKPAVMLDAVSQQLDMMKGLNPEARIYAQASIADRKNQVQLQEALTRAQSMEEAARIRAESAERWHTEAVRAQEEIARLKTASNERIGAGHDSARVSAAQIGGSSRVQAAGIGADARVQSAGIGATSRENVANTNADARGYAADQGYRGRVNSAQVTAGQKPTAGPGPRLKARGGQTGGGAPVPGARKAPDGMWYVPDPQRPGKYLKVG